MKKFFLYTFLFFLVFSCKKNEVYSEFKKLSEDKRWAKNQVKTFSFSIEKDGNYNVVLSVSHVYDYQFDSIPLACTIQNESNTKETIPFNLMIKDKSGKDIGDCAGDICDLEYIVKTNQHFKKGNYTISFSNSFSFSYVPNIIGIGCKILVAK